MSPTVQAGEDGGRVTGNVYGTVPCQVAHTGCPDPDSGECGGGRCNLADWLATNPRYDWLGET